MGRGLDDFLNEDWRFSDVDSLYDACYETGEYEDQDCEMCPHKYECSAYDGEED